MMNRKSTSALTFTCLTLLFSCGQGTNEKGTDQEIVLTNGANIDLIQKPVSISRSAFPEFPEEDLFPLLLTSQGDTLPSQLDDLDGDQQWDEVFFVTDLPANSEKILSLWWIATQPEYIKNTSVRFGKRSSASTPVQPKTSDTLYANHLPKSIGYQPYQTDGPSWENDKVGFRHYFDGRNAKDLFGKKVSSISPENVGIDAEGAVEDNYHVMEEWGRDILAVGNSVGIGGIALQIGDTLARLGVTVDDSVNNVERSTLNIVTEGPVRSILELAYHNWQPVDHSYEVSEKISIWPGIYAYQNTVELTNLQGNENLLVGLVNSRTEKPLTEIAVNEDWVVLFTHDQQTYEKEWWLGLALILPRHNYEGFLEAPESGRLSSSYFGKLKIENNQPVKYFTVAGWELGDQNFRDSTYFKNYVRNLAQQFSADVEVQIR